jgi:5-bromo-4-chloroindolyl phosphate hydrolysis protein
MSGTTKSKNDDSSAVQGIVSGFLGGGAFVVLFIFLDFAWWLALTAGVASFFTGYLIMRPRRNTVLLQVQGLAPGTVEKVLEEGRRKIEELRDFEGRITSPEVREEVKGIRDAAVRILEEIERDPGDVKIARPFLNYHFDATMKILRKYVELSERGAADTAIRTSLNKVENTLHLIRTAFEKQHSRLLENDTLDLDTEITVLEKTIRMEGLGDDIK